MATATGERVLEHFADAVAAGNARVAFSGGEAVQPRRFCHFQHRAAV